MPRTNLAACAAVLALALALIQFGVLRTVPSGLAARVVLPATVALIPLALWPQRGRLGMWIVFVGLAANLAAILANGGLMPIEHDTVIEAVGEDRALEYRPGDWIAGSKDVLLAPGEGHLRALGDGIVVRVGNGGFVASPGDLVVWCGLVVLAGELAFSWQRHPRSPADAQPSRLSPRTEGAEGGAATPS